MSERMIELQRARLLAAASGQGVSAAVPGASINGGLPSRGYVHGSAASGTAMPMNAGVLGGTSAGAAAAMTPQQAALHAMRQEDTSMQHFLQRLAHAGSSSSTVPPALSRRMLHRQGVEYRDPAIACVISGAADRFLSTVLQQAIVCRDQRLKGLQLAKDAARHRKRHKEQYELDVEERKRRRQDRLKKREDGYLRTIEAAAGAAPKPSPASSNASGGNANNDAPTKKPSKKKSAAADATAAAVAANGKKKPAADDDNDDDVDDDMHDSMDEEEEYYQKYYDDSHHADEDSDEEEENDMLILRDLAPPLEGWDFYVTGKEGMDPNFQQESDDEVGWDEDDETDVELNDGEGGASDGTAILDAESGETALSTAAQAKPSSPEKKAADSSNKPLAQAAKPAASTSPLPAQAAVSSTSNHRSSNPVSGATS